MATVSSYVRWNLVPDLYVPFENHWSSLFWEVGVTVGATTYAPAILMSYSLASSENTLELAGTGLGQLESNGRMESMFGVVDYIGNQVNDFSNGQSYTAFSLLDLDINAAELFAIMVTPRNFDDLDFWQTAFSGDDIFDLSDDDDIGHGYGGTHTINGNDGNDQLYGDGGRDTIQGSVGDDEIYGGSGGDRLYGDDSDADSAATGADTISGGRGNDRIEGGGDADNLYGGSGADRILGGNGDDIIYGQRGRDVMTGGDGNDVFIFTTIGESRVRANRADVITDFEEGDVIDLSAINAGPNTQVDWFAFVGTDRFQYDIGEVRYRQFDNDGRRNDYTMIFIDVDADTGAEMAIRLTGLHTLTESDLIR